ncbi:hypothetical protein ACJX0J_039145, partial [Zea mays]
MQTSGIEWIDGLKRIRIKWNGNGDALAMVTPVIWRSLMIIIEGHVCMKPVVMLTKFEYYNPFAIWDILLTRMPLIFVLFTWDVHIMNNTFLMHFEPAVCYVNFEMTR